MKIFLFALILLPTLTSYAQVADRSDRSGITNPEKKRFLDDLSLSFETEASTVRNDDQNNEITGRYQYYRLELSAKITKALQGSIGADYVERTYNEKEEDKTRDHLDNSYLKLRHNTLNFKNNQLLDLRMQIRHYRVEDDFFKERFGADGNYQVRAYFGRPIVGKFVINKYVSYLRYKKYYLNDDASARSRDYELRARLAPSYQPTKDLDFGVTATYNHIFTTSVDEEEIELGLSARKQIGKYAILFFTSNELYRDNDNGDLVVNEDFFEATTFFLNFNAIIF